MCQALLWALERYSEQERQGFYLRGHGAWTNGVITGVSNSVKVNGWMREMERNWIAALRLSWPLKVSFRT
jgi:hypothetical protein